MFLDQEQAAGVYIYNIPSLTIYAQELPSYQPRDMTTHFFIPFEFVPRRDFLLAGCRVICDWCTESGWPIWFDLVHQETPNFSRVKLVCEGNDIGTRRYGLRVFQTAPLGSGFIYEPGHQMAYENHETLLTWWRDPDLAQLHFHFDDTFPADGFIYENRDLVGSAVALSSIMLWTSFCAVTGRLVYFEPYSNPKDEWCGDEPRIIVVDYLPVE